MNDMMIEIGDTGASHSKKDIGCIFKPFFSTKCGDASTELNLSFDHGTMRQIDGFITIYLPCYKVDRTVNSPDESAAWILAADLMVV